MTFDDLKFAQRTRLEYLDRLFFWDGAATRASLIKRFDISNAQAALDFRTYLAEVPKGTLQYDASSRQYLAHESFERLTGRASSLEFEQLLSGEPSSTFDRLPDLQRTQDMRVLRPLYRAFRAKEATKIVYQSMRDPEPMTRWIAPVRFASDGVRLHVRAWCYEREGFRDFHPARIDADRSFDETKPAEEVPRDDDWFTWAILKLKPHSRLTDAQQRVVRIEFGFTSDVLEVKTRKALAFYTERRWGLEQKEPRLERVSIDYVPMSEEEINAN
ncbi:WYL domain-containing protein [Cohaesibacter marisflavi]|uniref:WYL domain-containing protein n=1 Tax=Cohaesibacter marisflavi TaxID=655353 RepID=UPI0029C71C2D|nr:WYL domain-containing protein [Cohaesibacter marisflavi]